MMVRRSRKGNVQCNNTGRGLEDGRADFSTQDGRVGVGRCPHADRNVMIVMRSPAAAEAAQAADFACIWSMRSDGVELSSRSTNSSEAISQRLRPRSFA